MILDDTELCFGELAYETRLVAFFDILGWKSEIEAAGNDPRHIARLAAAVRLFRTTTGVAEDAGAQLSTFSDNVVFSSPYVPSEVEGLLQSLAVTQLGLALFGFWMRGAVTVGEIYHDEHIVFGPALNQAHHLESKIAKYPRIILDSMIDHVGGRDFIEPGEPAYLDPFKPDFWDRVQSDYPVQQVQLEKFNELAGTTLPPVPVVMLGIHAVSAIAGRLSAELTSTDDVRAWEKLSWLFDRVMPRIASDLRARDLPKSFGLDASLNSQK